MTQRGKQIIVLDHDYVVDAGELLASISATRLRYGLKCEVMLHQAEASLQKVIILVSFI
jgi:hypothetical protein